MWEGGEMVRRAWPLKKSRKPIWALRHLGREVRPMDQAVWLREMRRMPLDCFGSRGRRGPLWAGHLLLLFSLGRGTAGWAWACVCCYVYFFLSFSFELSSKYFPNVFHAWILQNVSLQSWWMNSSRCLSPIVVMNILHRYIVKVGLLVRLATLRLLMSRSIWRAVLELLWDIQALEPTQSSHEMSEGRK